MDKQFYPELMAANVKDRIIQQRQSDYQLDYDLRRLSSTLQAQVVEMTANIASALLNKQLITKEQIPEVINAIVREVAKSQVAQKDRGGFSSGL